MRFDRILASSAVFTGQGDVAKAAAVAVADGRIAAVGDLEEVLALADDPDAARRQVEDLGDRFLCAGFHDSHVHFFHSALYSSPLACSFLGESEQDCVDRLRAFASVRPQGWLLAQGWREYRCGSASSSHQTLPGCGLPGTSRGSVLGRRAYAVDELPRARGAGGARGLGAPRGRKLRARR